MSVWQVSGRRARFVVSFGPLAAAQKQKTSYKVRSSAPPAPPRPNIKTKEQTISSFNFGVFTSVHRSAKCAAPAPLAPRAVEATG